MSKIVSVGIAIPPYELKQERTMEFAREFFSDTFSDIDRLLNVFGNGQIETRYVAKELAWFREKHSFQEKNDAFIESAVNLGREAIVNCLKNETYLQQPVAYEDIEAIFYISTTGLATPSIEARIMNELPFSMNMKRIPIWGLGCAGGAAGLSRAYEYCRAFPEAKVLVLAVELCSLTFQHNDFSKSNLIGTSLFADGVACVLVAGNEVNIRDFSKKATHPAIIGTQSTLMPHSEEVMGWDIKDSGLYVIFSKDIPAIVKQWFGENVQSFLEKYQLSKKDIRHFIAHPGGKKVLEAYVNSLNFDRAMIRHSLSVLKQYGNMSSATVFYVLNEFLKGDGYINDYGLITALGPGFSSELLLVKWG